MKKKTSLVAFLLVLTLFLSSCQNNNTFKEFKNYEESLNTVAEKAIEYFNNNNSDEDKLLLTFNDYSIWADSSLENHIDNISDITVNNLYLKNGYIWVSSDYAIFWFDDLKTYGLIYSHSALNEIDNINEWYINLDYNKLTDNWYEIGQLNTR